MRCSTVRKSLSMYLYGELAPQHRLRLEEHLSRCAACRQVAEELRAVVQLAPADVSETPPADVMEGLHRRLAAGQQRTSRLSWLVASPWPGLALIFYSVILMLALSQGMLVFVFGEQTSSGTAEIWNHFSIFMHLYTVVGGLVACLIIICRLWPFEKHPSRPQYAVRHGHLERE